MSSSTQDPTPRPPNGLRCRQPGVTRETLDLAIAVFETRLSDVPPYGPHLRWWIARYSRGDDLVSLRDAFAAVVDQVERDGEAARESEGDVALQFAYGPGFIGRYRDALVLLSIALCLRLPDSTGTLLGWCERGDALIELLAEANGATHSDRRVPPPFPEEFDGLYAALDAATPPTAADVLREYRRVWLDDRMDDMGFKIAERGIGYWCFEVAGVVARLGVDDSSFAAEPVYPAGLVAFYREGA